MSFEGFVSVYTYKLVRISRVLSAMLNLRYFKKSKLTTSSVQSNKEFTQQNVKSNRSRFY